MPRHALRSELAAKLSDGWTGPTGRHVIDSEMPTPTGVARRHALATEVDAITVGPPIVGFVGYAANKGFATTNIVEAVTGAQAGDVLLAFAGGNDQTTSLTPPAGAGWTLLADTAATTQFGRLRLYKATATAPNQAGGTWTWSGSHNHVVSILAYRGFQAPTAAVLTGAANATTLTVPTQTTTAAGSLLIEGAYWTTNGSTPMFTGTPTSRVPSSGASASMLVAEETIAAAGATGTRTFTPGGTPSAMTAIATLLGPA